MRPTLLANLEDQSILCGGIVENGDVFRFSLPPDFEVIDKVIESSIEIKKNKMPDADALIVFSCVGRFASLGPMINYELEGLTKTWHKPMIGFFCLGEFGKAERGDKAEFHGTTCSWVALKEK
jgi:small ligand-binding sensory domain FIST